MYGIKINGEYLDFDGDFDLEEKVKLFEEISTVDGSFSYQFELPKTNKNLNVLGLLSFSSVGKAIYSQIDCDIIGNDGYVLHSGVLKVQGNNDVIEAEFFSGNTNWVNEIIGDLKDLDLSSHDISNTLANVIASWTNTSGVVWPLVDKGKLSDRLSPSMVYDERPAEDLYLNNDFHPFIFLKNVFLKIFTEAQFKVTGSLFKDWRYNNLIMTSNPANSQELLDARSCYVGKTSNQAINTGSFTKLTWVDNTDPYYDGDEDNFDTTNNRWAADSPCVIEIITAPQFDTAQTYEMQIHKNGVLYSSSFFGTASSAYLKIHSLEVDASDYIEVFAKPLSSNANCIPGSYFRVTVLSLKKVFSVDLLPDITKFQFIKNIFKMFNVVATYDKTTRTINLELFKNIKTKEPQDLSQYIDPDSIELDYYTFIDRYGKKNNFKFAESSAEEIELYNRANEIPYGGGQIVLDNTYLQDESTIAELDFVAPYQYLNDPFQMSLLKLNYLDEDETEEDILDSVTDNAGVARFNFSGVPPFASDDGDIIRIKTTSTGNYIGTGVIINSGIGFFELAGVGFRGTCTGTFVKVNYAERSNDDPILALFINSSWININSISPIYQGVYINDTIYFQMGYAYFSKDYQGVTADTNLKQGLSFASINTNSFFQKTLIDDYYSTLDDILNDPVKAIANFNLPTPVYQALDFTRPVYLNTYSTKNGEQVVGHFYLNRVSGYRDSSKPCVMELIKMS